MRDAQLVLKKINPAITQLQKDVQDPLSGDAAPARLAAAIDILGKLEEVAEAAKSIIKDKGAAQKPASFELVPGHLKEASICHMSLASNIKILLKK